MEFKLKVLSAQKETHDTMYIRIEKPANFRFVPGHAAMLSINFPSLVKEIRPFTFTATNSDPFLEFIIKSYPSSPITKEFHALKKDDELIMHSVFGAHRYKGSGLFIAAGSGITPFLAMFRQLRKDNALSGIMLLYSNKTQSDIIKEEELKSLLGDNCIFTLTREKKLGYKYGRINQKFLQDHIQSKKLNYYICGSEQFVFDMKNIITELQSGQL